ncbi:MAG: alpha-glucan phosphorylase, partial [bacterium]
GVSRLRVGAKLPVEVQVDIGRIDPKDVRVEFFYGPLSADGEIVGGKASPLKYKKSEKNHSHVYSGSILTESSGQFGFSVRILPNHPALRQPFEMGLIYWWR